MASLRFLQAYGSLFRLVLAQNELRIGTDRIGIILPKHKKFDNLRKQCEEQKIPVCDYISVNYDRYGIERRSTCYGGGIRPIFMRAGMTGQETIYWWTVSGGLGPGAVNQKTFCYIVDAVTRIYNIRNICNTYT